MDKLNTKLGDLAGQRNVLQQTNSAKPYIFLTLCLSLSVITNTWVLLLSHMLLGQLYCRNTGLKPPKLNPRLKHVAFTAYFRLWWPYYVWQRYSH